MNAKVLPVLLNFTSIEGLVKWMYMDCPHDKDGKPIPPRLLTVGLGFMIDPVENFASSYVGKFRDKNTGAIVTDAATIIAEGNKLKKMVQDNFFALMGYKTCESITNLRLTEDFCTAKARELLLRKETALKTDPRVKDYFANFEKFRLDAQLACISRAYGRIETPTTANESKSQAYYDACKAQDWAAAAENCQVRGWYQPKNQAHSDMFTNAAYCDANALPPDTLLWPERKKLAATPPAAPAKTGDGTTGMLWLNRDDKLVHPDAPYGSQGAGYFRLAGDLTAAHSDHGGLLHPGAPAAKTLDPLVLQRLIYDLRRVKSTRRGDGMG